MTGWLLVCLGAAVGAPARYLVDRAVQARHDSLMPWGTLTVNVFGSAVLGVLAGLGADENAYGWTVARSELRVGVEHDALGKLANAGVR